MNLRKGFTLIELLVVVSIIGTLATIIVASLSRARNKAIDVRMLVKANELQKGIEAYDLFEGRLPTSGSNVVGGYTIATSCDNPNWTAHRDNWNEMTIDMGEYLPNSFVNEDGDWPFCIFYMLAPTHPNCDEKTDGDYLIMFGTLDSSYATIDQYIDSWGSSRHCLYELE